MRYLFLVLLLVSSFAFGQNQKASLQKGASFAMAYQGNFTSNCNTWLRNNVAWGDFSIDNSSCTLTDIANINFGIVTAKNDGTPGNNYPGIVFTPKTTGAFYICVNGHVGSGNAAGPQAIRLWDGTISYGEYSTIDSTSDQQKTFTLCAIANFTSIASKSFWLQSKGTNVYLSGATVADITYGQNWTIIYLGKAQ